MPKVPKMTSLQYLCNIVRKGGVINVIFYMKVNINVFYKLIVSFLLVMTSHAQSLWYLCNISKKREGLRLIFFHADNHETSTRSYY